MTWERYVRYGYVSVCNLPSCEQSCLLLKMDEILRIPPQALAEAAAELRQCLRTECEEMCSEMMEEQGCHRCEVLHSQLQVSELDAKFHEEQNAVLQTEVVTCAELLANRSACADALRAEMRSLQVEHECKLAESEMREQHAENRLLHLEMAAVAVRGGRNSK